MRKMILTFIKSEIRETDSTSFKYNIFFTEENKQLAIRQNNVSSYMSKLIENEKYNLYMDYNACHGIEYQNVLIFNHAGNIIMKRDNDFFQMNPVRHKKPLSENSLKSSYKKFSAKF